MLRRALVPAGCGGGEEAAVVGSPAASIAPASSAAYVEVNTDLDSGQWERLKSLSEQFPGRQRLVDEILDQLGEEGLEWERDIDPALGPTLVVVLLEGADEPVLLTQPDDPAKLEALREKSDDPSVSEEIDDWHAIANEQADLDAFKRALDDGFLADDDEFQEAMNGLPSDVLARAYVARSAFERALENASDAPIPGLEDLDWLAAALTAEEDGVRVEGAVSAPGFEGGENYTPELLAKIPAGAFAVLSFSGIDESLRQLRDNPALEQQLPQLEQAAGVTLDDLADLFSDEIALFLRPGSPIPEITLLLAGAGEDELATVDKLASRLSVFVQGRLGSDDVDGVQTKYLEIRGVRVSYAAFDDMVVVTSLPNAIRDLRSDDDKLSDDENFERAKEAAGLGDETGGFFYVNLGELVPLIEGFAGIAGEPLPDEVAENLEPLDSLVIHVERDGDQFRFTGFLGVR